MCQCACNLGLAKLFTVLSKNVSLFKSKILHRSKLQLTEILPKVLAPLMFYMKCLLLSYISKMLVHFICKTNLTQSQTHKTGWGELIAVKLVSANGITSKFSEFFM